MKLMIPLVAAGTLLCSTAVAAQADTGQNNLQTSSITQQNVSAFERVSDVMETAAVTSSATATLSFERPVVKTTPAPPKPVENPVVKASQDTPTAAAAVAAPAVQVAPAPAPAAAVSPTNPANIPAAPGVASNGATDAFGEKLVAAALNQVGVNQDCTALVSNSLKAVGISFHGWPKDYQQLGSLTTNPQPGDLIYYANGGGAAGMAHIALYIGGGKAVHGGWDGYTTKVFSANVGSGPIYIHVNR